MGPVAGKEVVVVVAVLAVVLVMIDPDGSLWLREDEVGPAGIGSSELVLGSQSGCDYWTETGRVAWQSHVVAAAAAVLDVAVVERDAVLALALALAPAPVPWQLVVGDRLVAGLAFVAGSASVAANGARG